MSSNIGSLAVYLTADVKGFQSAMNGAVRTLQGFSRNAMSYAAAGGAALTGLGVMAVKAFGVQEDAVNSLSQTLKSTNYAAGFNPKQIEEFAGELQKLTTVGDEVSIKAMSVLATFTNIRGDNFKQATVAALDMSKALGGDLQSSIVQIGKALQDPVKGVTALRKVGVMLTDDQEANIKKLVEAGKMQEAQQIVLNELQVEFGGQAAAAANTVSGRIQQLANAWGDVMEAAGGFLVELFDINSAAGGLTETMANLANTIKENAFEWALAFKSVWIEIKYGFLQSYTLAANIISGIGSIFKTAGQNIINIGLWIYENFKNVFSNLFGLAKAYALDTMQIWKGIFREIMNTLTLKDTNWTGVIAEAQKNLERKMKDIGTTELKIAEPDYSGFTSILSDAAKLDAERQAAQNALESTTMKNKLEQVKLQKTFTASDKYDMGSEKIVKNLKDEKLYSSAMQRGTAEAYRVGLAKPGGMSIEGSAAETAKNTKQIASNSSQQTVLLQKFANLGVA